MAAPLGWLLRDYRRYKAYRLRVAELLAAAGLDPAHFSEAETQRLENAVRRCFFKQRPHQYAVARCWLRRVSGNQAPDS